MIHPLSTDLSKLKDSELEVKIQELSKKYWQARNPIVQSQLITFLDIYNEELKSRRMKTWEQQSQINEKGLDKLINVN
jgi:hypothetical protein